MNFAALDLNLLRVFDAMMLELSTVKAGERIGLSQPAVSSALGRLRHFTGDELFVRDGNRMVPTSRALELAAPLRDALAKIEEVLTTGSVFDPATSITSFMLGGSDYFSTMLMPELARNAAPVAPRVTFQMIDCTASQVSTLLSDGKVDLAVDRTLDVPEWISRQKLFTSYLVCVARKDHPVIVQSGLKEGGTIDAELFCRIPHILYSADGTKRGTVDPGLEKIGLRREIAMTVSQFQAVALAIASSDLIGNLPIHFARVMARYLPIDFYEPPIPSPRMDIYAYWHKMKDREGASIWLRKQVRDVLDFDRLK
ncbi:LysR family transcriptional regulator [Rhizobium viscosum]|uniref:DNA-binding transcriptional LysR family regulator n=1 Tax=Rhizobium viscosum TaxID=1673 RepID=A0ABR9J007_RHIVS|nr:LysR family transcriptional regulator [Rhizobium viscosum]MBE1508809.1 DNA-binding transcriptional LysR family regulator [Rhizobium viscosum]